MAQSLVDQMSADGFSAPVRRESSRVPEGKGCAEGTIRARLSKASVPS